MANKKRPVGPPLGSTNGALEPGVKRIQCPVRIHPEIWAKFKKIAGKRPGLDLDQAMLEFMKKQV